MKLEIDNFLYFNKISLKLNHKKYYGVFFIIFCSPLLGEGSNCKNV